MRWHRHQDAAPSEVDWSLLGLLLSLEGCTPTVIYGSDLSGFSSAMPEDGRVITLDPGITRTPLPDMREQASNVSRICGEPSTHLPFRDGSLGAMVANLMDCRRPGDETAQAQAHLFAEASRVLRPGGLMCFVADRRENPLTPSRCRALLHRCGFSRDEGFLAFPGRRRFSALVPIGAGRAMCACIDVFVEGNAFRERRKRLWLKLLALAGLLPYLASEYVVFARKGI